MSEQFIKPALQRLEEYLVANSSDSTIEELTPDASTREFYRLSSEGKSIIACLYDERFDSTLPQLDVTKLFLAANLPVAQIIDVDFDLGIVVHEDFGDDILRDSMETAQPIERESLIDEAISLIARIQASTPLAFELKSIASQLSFDREKLIWELNFFKTHYFETLRNSPLSKEENVALEKEFESLAVELESRASVLTHRDFHAANLMIGNDGKLKIIDHQDARLGSIAYDLVSLLLDRITILPSTEWLKEKKSQFLEKRGELDLAEVQYVDFDFEFDLMAIQRSLKAIGTFSFQSANRGRTHFVKFINPMFLVVSGATQRLNRYPVLTSIVQEQLK